MTIKSRIFSIFAALSLGTVGALAATSVNPPAPPSSTVTGAYPVLIASSTMTRPANTTTYTANTAVCATTSVTPCVPMTVSLATTSGGKGLINRVLLLKSGPTSLYASFNIYFYSTATPTTAAIFDNTAYAGPFKADIPYYLGSAGCLSPNLTTDSSAGVWYECTLSNPNTGGVLEFQAAAGSTNITAVIQILGAYVPASGETFTFYVGGMY